MSEGLFQEFDDIMLIEEARDALLQARLNAVDSIAEIRALSSKVDLPSVDIEQVKKDK